MEQNQASGRLHTVTVMRNLLLIGVALSLTANILLAWAVVEKQQSVIVLPAIQSGQAYELRDGQVSTAYLEDMARSVVMTMGNLTPGAKDYVRDSILKLVHPSFYGTFKRLFDKWLEEIRSRRLSTAFYPLSVTADTENLEVHIRGVLKSFIGEKQVHAEQLTYRLAFDYTGTRLTLLRFEEERKEE